MIPDLAGRTAGAVDRYSYFLDVLRSQADIAFRRGLHQAGARDDAFHRGLDAARAYAGVEHAQLNEDTQEVAIAGYGQARSDLGLATTTIEERFGDFIFSASLYTARVLAAQAERDVMSMVQHVRTTAQRVDLYVRSGRHSVTSAAAAVMQEDDLAPSFRFVDRIGRRFKSSKHVRDAYRQHLLSTYNEVYMDVVAEHGLDMVQITHPDPAFKWFGQNVAIVGGGQSVPLYYDIRDEVFHPSSEATLTIEAR